MRRGLAGVLMVVILGSCGVPLDSEPVLVDIDYEPPPSVATTDAEGLVATLMFLVRSERLVPVTRDLTEPIDPAAIVQSLLDGPTLPEERSQLRTAIPAGTTLIGVEAQGAEVFVDLSREFVSVGGEEEILAIAQIVLTLTSLDGVERVGFRLDGVATNVPLPNGALSQAPVSGEPYLELLAIGDEE